MKFNETPLSKAFVIEMDRREDERGYFARTFCRDEFEALGLDSDVAQCNVSYNTRRGTLRGLHYQSAPHQESKLVRCTRGAVFDVIVDLRAGSPTLHRWYGIELEAERGTALYVPKGFAHGFLTLTDHSEVLYQMTAAYEAGSANGIRWDDSMIGIEWPFEPCVMSQQDRTRPPIQGAA